MALHPSSGECTSQDIVPDANPASNSLKYRSLLKEIDNGLGERDMDKLRYLCQDLGIAPRKFEYMKRGIHLFSELEKLALITPNDISLLALLMHVINRYDLVKKLKSWSGREGTLAHRLSEYRKLMLRISDSLARDERDQLTFYLSGGESPLPVSVIEESKTPLQLFAQMEKYMMMGPDDVAYLAEIMKLIGNFAIVKEIQKYQESVANNSGQAAPSPQPNPAVSSWQGTSMRQLSDPGATSHHFNLKTAPPSSYHIVPQPRRHPSEWQQQPRQFFQQPVLLGQQLQIMPRQQAQQPVHQGSDEQQWRQQLVLQQEYQQKQQLLLQQAKLQQEEAERQSSAVNSLVGERQAEAPVAPIPYRPQWYHEAVQKYGQAHADDMWEKIISVTNKDIQERMRKLRLSQGDIPEETTPPIKMEGGEVLDDMDEASQRMTVPCEQERQQAAPERRVVRAQTAVVTKQSKRDAAERQSPAVLPRYRMDRLPRGYCVIFNAKNFTQASRLQRRDGTDRDVEKLLNTFQNRLKFETAVVNDPRGQEYIRTLDEIRNFDHSKRDCFACIILSHGSRDVVFGVDGEKVAIHDLTGLFRGAYCRSLLDKPKLFFIQACQGEDAQTGIALQQDATSTIPNESDILISLSTVPGFSSNRSVTQGSWYISTLCHVMNTYYQSTDLLSMLTMVNNLLSEAADKQNMKQIGMPSHTLRKQIYFNEGFD